MDRERSNCINEAEAGFVLETVFFWVFCLVFKSKYVVFMLYSDHLNQIPVIGNKENI